MYGRPLKFADILVENPSIFQLSSFEILNVVFYHNMLSILSVYLADFYVNEFFYCLIFVKLQ